MNKIILLIFCIFFINFINAEVLKSNSSVIQEIYAPSEFVSGIINVSFVNEPAESLLNCFDQSVLLKDFLDANNADYLCTPFDCTNKYKIISSPDGLATFELNPGETKLVGVKLNGIITGVSVFNFNVSTDAGKSCSIPLKMDIFDDQIVDYKANKASNDFSCPIDNMYGCYEDSIAQEKFLITTSTYCEKINISSSAIFKIGANVIKRDNSTGNTEFKLDISSSSGSGNCIAIGNSTGEISCSVPLVIENNEEANVCLSLKNSADNNKYEIKYETTNPCGYAGTEIYDFPIFAKPGKYDSIKSFKFNNNQITNNFYTYIIEKYDGNCTNDCIVPIRFYAGINQMITVSDLNLIYSTGGAKSESNVYYIEEDSALINSEFQDLDLSIAGFEVPSSYGTKTLELKLNNNTIFSKAIQIRTIPRITGIVPTEAPAFVNILFIGLVDDGNATGFIWEFDGKESFTTVNNSIKFSFNSTGQHSVKLTAINNVGNYSKTEKINVIAPKEIINKTISDYEKKLDQLQVQINSFPENVKKEIEKRYNVEDFKDELKTQKNKYDVAFSDDEFTEIMRKLVEMRIPNYIKVSQSIPESSIIISSENINEEDLDKIGAGKSEQEIGLLKKSIISWLNYNLETKFKSETYSLYYDNEIVPLFSDVKLTLIPKSEIEEIYLIITNSDINFIDNNLNPKTLGENSEGLIFSDLKEQQIIEFFLPEKINIGNLPFYISPQIKDLDFSTNIEACNFNNRCEKDLGENYSNCRTDCKPYALSAFWIIMIIFFAFVVYIIMQEWYKRYYENYLFKDKNQLFNIINFMNNAINQGMKKEDIYRKLKDFDWNNEQINYAWKKLHGMRTGMWEIPIFKWIEKRQVKKELEKRNPNKNIIIKK